MKDPENEVRDEEKFEDVALNTQDHDPEWVDWELAANDYFQDDEDGWDYR